MRIVSMSIGHCTESGALLYMRCTYGSPLRDYTAVYGIDPQA